MHANDLVVNDSATGETVECIAELLPHLDRKPTAALVIEAINPIDTCALVVSTQQEEVFWVFDLVGEQKANHFQGLLSAVNVVSQEKVVGLIITATDGEQQDSNSERHQRHLGVVSALR